MQNRFSELFLSHGTNYFIEDKPLQEMIKYMGVEQNSNLSSLGKYVSTELIESLDFIDHFAKPVLQTWNLLGERIDYVRISPDHERALKTLQDFDVVRSLKGNPPDLMHHFLSGYLISDSGIFCTLTLTAQTAYIIQKYAGNEVKEKYLGNFFRGENPWYGATFYTEVQGGSDLGANRTLAYEENGQIYLEGSDKYFASDSGLADATLVTARFKDSPGGAKGISLFLVPSHLDDGRPNYIIRRLKNKLGTTAVPTGEVEFSKSLAYQIGNTQNGIYLAMEALVISRIDDAIAALGIARKALWEAYLYSLRRKAFGKFLIDHPLLKRDIIELEVGLESAMALSMLAAKSFSDVSMIGPPYNRDYQLSRVIGNIAKTVSAETSAQVTRYSMEILGGIGFLEEFPMAKFHRDSIVTSIWEGTSNIQSLEVLEVLRKPKEMEHLEQYLVSKVSMIRDKEMAGSIKTRILSGLEQVRGWYSSEEPEFYAKEALLTLGNLIAACEMALAGQAVPGGVFSMSSKIFFRKHVLGLPMDHTLIEENSNLIKWMKARK